MTAITTTQSKAEKLNQFIGLIHGDEIERFFVKGGSLQLLASRRWGWKHIFQRHSDERPGKIQGGESDVIVGNRFNAEALGSVEEKVYTEDLFRRDY